MTGPDDINGNWWRVSAVDEIDSLRARLAEAERLKARLLQIADDDFRRIAAAERERDEARARIAAWREARRTLHNALDHEEAMRPGKYRHDLWDALAKAESALMMINIPSTEDDVT